MQHDYSSQFFCRPMTYFGSYPNVQEEDLDEEEWNFATSWQMSLDTDLLFSLQQKTGIFIHWCEPC